MLEVFKILHGYENIDASKFFDTAENPDSETPQSNIRTRGHAYKLKKRRFKHIERMKFFDARVVNKWNFLDGIVTCSTSINTFKKNYDAFIEKLKRRGKFYEFLTL